jgi:hypothetical protein
LSSSAALLPRPSTVLFPLFVPRDHLAVPRYMGSYFRTSWYSCFPLIFSPYRVPPRGTTLRCPVTWRATYFCRLIPYRGRLLVGLWRFTYFLASYFSTFSRTALLPNPPLRPPTSLTSLSLWRPRLPQPCCNALQFRPSLSSSAALLPRPSTVLFPFLYRRAGPPCGAPLHDELLSCRLVLGFWTLNTVPPRGTA